MTKEILVSKMEKKENKERKNSTILPFSSLRKSVYACMHVCVCVCVCVRVCICVTAPHGDRIAFNEWHDEKSGIIFLHLQCTSVNRSEVLVDVACASNNIFVNTAVD